MFTSAAAWCFISSCFSTKCRKSSASSTPFGESGTLTASLHEISYYGYTEGAETGSLHITASHIQVSGNLNVGNNVDIGGSLSFDGFTFSDGNISILSGSNIFGSGSNNTHEFTGSILTSGSITLGEYDKLVGTSSWADKATTSSHALTSSYIAASNIDGQAGFPYSGSDFANHVSFSNHAAAVITGSLILTSGYSASGQITASGNISSSGTIFASQFTGSEFYSTHTESNAISFFGTASHASTASYINASNIEGIVEGAFPYSGSDTLNGTPSQAVITGSLLLSGSGHITASGTIKAANVVVTSDLTVHGNLIISGTSTTIHTENLVIEDRFIVIGSGSNATANLDVGIIFDSGSIDGGGMGLFFDNSANRLAIGKNLNDTVISNTSSNYEVGNPNVYPDEPSAIQMGTVAGNVMTIRSTGSDGTNLNTGSDVQLGKGEMLIDKDDDVWIYV